MILPVLIVYVLTRTFWWAAAAPWLWEAPMWTEGVMKVALWVLPTILVTMALRRTGLRGALGELGLTTPAWPGVRVAVAATLPMAAIASSSSGFTLHFDALLSTAIFGPFAEEVLYRGFLFQQLYRRARWPVWAAALGSALVFALAHHKDLDAVLALGFLRNDLMTQVGTLGPPLLATVAGGGLFAWLSWRWRSLWPAIALHAAINFWWDIAAGGADPAVSTASHAMALTLVIALTWRQTLQPAVVLPDSGPVA